MGWQFLAVICTVCSAILCATAAQVKYTNIAPAALMPDGTVFQTWADQTRYTKTYHVSQSDPRASDENPGTEDRPFRTIDHAAQIVKPAERVQIHAGVYREMVQPRFSGEAPDRMIAYEPAAGEQVIVKGSRVLKNNWDRSRDPKGDSPRAIFSKKLWMTALPDTLFANGYFPFRTPNASNEELDLMPWALRWKGRIPYSLPRGMLFQEERRMTQLATYEDLVRLTGSFWVAPDGKTVHINPFGGGNPNGKLFEIAVQSHIFKPQAVGFGFIRVSGLIMEQCANGIPRAGVGALNTMGGHHWIIEGNTVRNVNSVGIEIGYQTFEYQDSRYPPRQDPNIGHIIVRNNRIYECGTAGIRALTTSYALVENNEIMDCGWQDAEFHWEVAGIKLLINLGTLVRNNHIARMTAGGGIWLDWNNINSRVTGNVIHDVSTAQGAIFVEASQQPNLVDNNIIWNVDGQGVRVADTDNLVIAHNLFWNITEDLVVAKVATTRSLGGRKLTSTGNRVLNNIFIDPAKPMAFDPGNVSDYNVYVSTRNEMGWNVPDEEKHSVALRGGVQMNLADLLLTWKPAEALPVVPAIRSCEWDFAGQHRGAEFTVAGPFVAFSRPTTVKLVAR